MDKEERLEKYLKWINDDSIEEENEMYVYSQFGGCIDDIQELLNENKQLKKTLLDIKKIIIIKTGVSEIDNYCWGDDLNVVEVLDIINQVLERNE